MAPDLNSVPPSPRSLLENGASTPRLPSRQGSTGPASGLATVAQAGTTSSSSTSRRASQIHPMSPPPLPLASPTGSLPAAQTTGSSQHQQPFPPLSPLITSSSGFVSTGHGGEGTGIPMRHPRPLTAAELHHELEKEQEAVVNRLTRELTALRAHSASVASTASSASTQPTPADVHPQSMIGSRQHRSSSSVSRGSFSHGIPLNPSTATMAHQSHHHRTVLTGARDGAMDGQARVPPAMARTLSNVSTTRYEETAQARLELEEAKRENEALRQRVRELEGQLRNR